MGLSYEVELEFAANLAREAGAFLATPGKSYSKSSATDIVTDADLSIHNLIDARIRAAFPGDVVLSEEGPDAVGARRWIVDPIDGTSNFVRRMWPSVISIALEEDGQLVVGVVYDPWLDDMYAAAPGVSKFSIKRTVDLKRAFIGISGSNRPGEIEGRAAAVNKLIFAADSVRDMGSSAMQLCLVARGALDAHIVMDTNIWDIAAGFVIAREAGYVMEGFEPNTRATPKRAIVGPPELITQIRTVLGDPPKTVRP